VKLRAYAGEMGECYVLAEEVRWDWGEDAFVDHLRAILTRGPRP